MPVSKYFNHITQEPVQDLIKDLIQESIEHRGYDVNYIQKDDLSQDYLFGESHISEYKNSKSIEMYIEDVQNFNGDGDLFSGFGIEMTDKATFIVLQRRWLEEFEVDYRNEPIEGDLIYLPFSDSLFEIKKVKYDDEYYQYGVNYKFRLECDLFTYSNETFDTGIDEIDDISDLNLIELVGNDEDDTIEQRLKTDLSNNNDQLDDEYKNYKEFDKENPFNE